MKNLKPLIAAMLLLCLAHMPYGYYTLMRFAAMTAFIVMAVEYNKLKREALAILFGCLALLFQPFFKVAMQRDTWNVVDVAVAVLLVILWTKERRDRRADNETGK